MNYHRGPRWQQGAGIGSLFSGIFRGLMPVAKSAISTIGKVAKSNVVKSAGRTLKKAALETALDALDNKPVGERAKQRLKTATRSILLNAANRPSSKENIPSSKKRKKPRQNYPVKRKRVKKQPMFDDEY